MTGKKKKMKVFDDPSQTAHIHQDSPVRCTLWSAFIRQYTPPRQQFWMHPLNLMSFLSFSLLSTLQFPTEGIKATFEHTWNEVGNNGSVK